MTKNKWECTKDEGLILVHNLMEMHKDCFIFSCPGIDFVITNNLELLEETKIAIQNQINFLKSNDINGTLSYEMQ